MLSGILIVVNLLLNMFGIRSGTVTLHSLLYHVLTGNGIPVNIEQEQKSEYRMLRASGFHTFPLFFYFA